MSDQGSDREIDWQKAKELFGEAMRLPRDERGRFVAEKCSDDQQLAVAVNELLEAAERTDGPIERIIGEAAIDLGAESQTTDSKSPPSRIGAYRVLNRIGVGGMGQVFLAERADDQFEQKVAIKILGTRFASPELVRRFRTERQILANLNHPNVARLLDGGETEDGLPFLAMEYVEGSPILDYCKEQRLGLKQRLSLFLSVCDAIQHAHQNFVIHRDIKSSNVIVAADGTVKLLDFGIAKLLQSQLMLHTIAETMADARLLTPANASPEQLQNGQITTATDVYGLGLLLYELMTGHPAYELSSVSRSELEQVICETMPSPPSSRITQSVNDTSADYGSTRDRLRRTLLGDLDTIVMKALRKEPERRYGTVREFAEDIERYLSDEPVRARAEGFFYRARKFVVRNRAAVVGTVAVFLVAAGLTLFYTDRVATERDRADLRAEEAEQTSQFLISLLNGANRLESSEQMTIDEILDIASERVEAEMSDVPDLQSKLHYVIGAAYTSIENYERSFFHHEKALEYLRQQPATFEREAAYSEIAQALSVLYRNYGDYDKSLEVSEEVLALNERIFEPDDYRISYGLNKHGQIFYALGQYEEALQFLERAVAVGLAGVGEENEYTADAMNNLAIAYSTVGDWDKTEEYYARALNANRAVLPRLHPNLANSIANYGLFLNNVQRYQEARPYLEESLALRRETFAGVQSRQVALGAESLGTNLTWLGEFTEAEQLLLEGLEITREVLGPDHPTTARRHRNTARMYLVLQNYPNAVEHYEHTLRILSDAFGDEHPLVHWAHQDVGRSLLGLERLNEAHEHLELAYRGTVAVHGNVHANVYPTQKALGDYYVAVGDIGNAERYYQESVESCIAGYGEDHPCRSNAMLGLAAIAGTRGENDRRLELLRDAITLRESLFDPDSWFTAEARLDYCEALMELEPDAMDAAGCERLPTVLLDLFGAADTRAARAAALLTSR